MGDPWFKKKAADSPCQGRGPQGRGPRVEGHRDHHLDPSLLVPDQEEEEAKEAADLSFRFVPSSGH